MSTCLVDTYLVDLKDTGHRTRTQILVVGALQTWISEKEFPLIAFTSPLGTKEGHLASVLLAVTSPNRSWLSHQIRANVYVQLFCDGDYYPLGPSRDWTAIANLYWSQKRGWELKGFVGPQRPRSGFCPMMKTWVVVPSPFPTECQSLRNKGFLLFAMLTAGIAYVSDTDANVSS